MEPYPRDLGAERALLSALMLDPSHFARLAGRVRPDYFTHALHRQVFDAMSRCAKAGLDLDPITILAEIAREDGAREKFEAAHGVGLLADLLVDAPPSRGADSYLALIEEAWHKAGVLRAAEEMRSMAQNGCSSADLARLFAGYSRRMERVLTRTEGMRAVSVGEAIRGELAAVPWIAEGWIGEGDLVVFAGEWASGKSLIALDLALSVAAGMPWMGRVPIALHGPALYLDEENNARNVIRRLKRMVAGRNADPEIAAGWPIRYLTKNHLSLSSPTGLATLRREVEATRPALLVLDSLIRFLSGDENSNSEIAAFFAEITPIATEFRCAILVLDHMRKPAKDDDRHDPGHRVRGAGDKAGVADGLWTLEGDRETDARTLSCRKNRWEDSLPPAITTHWRVSEDEAAAWIEASDASLSAEAAVLAALGASRAGLPASRLFDACEAAGIARRTAIRAVRRMKKSGAISFRSVGRQGVRYWTGTLEVP